MPSRLRLTLCLGLLLAGGWALRGQTLPTGFTTARSHSEQFTITGRPQPSILNALLQGTEATNYVRLQPTLMAMTCERIKDAVLMRLGARDAWRGKVYIIIRPIRRLNDPLTVERTHFKDGWHYRVEVPDAVAGDRLVRVIVQLLLTEWADRHMSGGTSDLPRWLVDGLSQELMLDAALSLILRPPEGKLNQLLLRETTARGRRPSTLIPARAYFATHAPYDFEELSWPLLGDASSASLEGFRYSAQLFVNELLQLREGGACLVAMLDHLGSCRNWQTAFLRAFSQHFGRMLDVDKWWTLQTAHFQQRSDSLTWTPAETLRQLNAIVIVPVRPGEPAADAPRTSLPLAELLLQTPPKEQEALLKPRIERLHLMLTRAHPSFTRLAQAYLEIMVKHTGDLKRGLRGTSSQRLNRWALDQLTRAAATKLDALDRQRTTTASPAVTKVVQAPARS